MDEFEAVWSAERERAGVCPGLSSYSGANSTYRLAVQRARRESHPGGQVRARAAPVCGERGDTVTSSGSPLYSNAVAAEKRG
jgi:hypothetical protein